MNYSSVISHHTDRSASTKRQWVGSKSADYHPPVGAALLEAPRPAEWTLRTSQAVTQGLSVAQLLMLTDLIRKEIH